MRPSIVNVWRRLYAEELEDKPRVNGRPDEVRVHCPFHQDEHPSCDVNLAKDAWICRSCGMGGGVTTLIVRECNISADSVKAWISNNIAS